MTNEPLDVLGAEALLAGNDAAGPDNALSSMLEGLRSPATTAELGGAEAVFAAVSVVGTAPTISLLGRMSRRSAAMAAAGVLTCSGAAAAAAGVPVVERLVPDFGGGPTRNDVVIVELPELPTAFVSDLAPAVAEDAEHPSSDRVDRGRGTGQAAETASACGQPGRVGPEATTTDERPLPEVDKPAPDPDRPDAARGGPPDCDPKDNNGQPTSVDKANAADNAHRSDTVPARPTPKGLPADPGNGKPDTQGANSPNGS